jgi:hypothetical protein
MARFGFWICTLGSLLTLFLPGCGDDKKTTEPVPSHYRPQSSIENVLYNLRESYMRRDLAAYRLLFAPEFEFRFNPLDALNPSGGTPLSWNLAEECRAADSLFSSTQVDSISIEWLFADAATDSAGTWIVQPTTARVLIASRNLDGEPLVYLVSDAPERFYLRSYPQERASDGQPLWRVTRWADGIRFRNAGPGSETLTWGMIKFIFSR